MVWLRQGTATILKMGPFLDDTDGKTAETGLSIGQADIQISKNGAAFAQTSASSPTTTHDADGWYPIPLTISDTDNLGTLDVQVAMSGALPVFRHLEVVQANIWDSFFSTDNLQVDTVQWLGTACATPTVNGVPEVDLTHWNGTAVATPDTAGYPKVTIKAGTGTGEISLASGVAKADVDTIKTQAVTCAAGVTVNTNVGTTQPVNFTGTGASAYVKTDMVDIAGVTVSTTTAQVGANIVQISEDATAANNCESFFDGTGYGGTGNTIPMVTSVTNQVSADITAIHGDTTAASNCESFFDGTGYAGTNNVIPSVTTVTGNVTGSIGSLGTTAKSDVNTEVDTALSDIDLDHFGKVGSAPTPASGSYIDKVMNKTGGGTSYDQTTDSLEAIRDAAAVAPTNFSSLSIDANGRAKSQDRATKGTSFFIQFPMMDSSNPLSRKTGLTVAGTISKDGGTFASLTNAISEVGTTGFYKVTITSTEMTADLVSLLFTATGGVDRMIDIATQP